MIDHVVAETLSAIAEKDWDDLRLRLHPYLRWTWPDGSTTRGRLNVMDALRRNDTPDIPSWFELRDGQIYRWNS